MSIQEKLDLAEKNLEWLLEWIGRFDNKTSVILALNTGMLGVLASFAPPLHIWTPVVYVTTIISLLSLGLSFLFVYLGMFPQTSGPRSSLLYFGSIAKIPILKYQQDFAKQSVEEHLNDVLEQSHRNSEILNGKFKFLKLAYCTLLISLIPWASTLYFFRSILTP